MSLKLLITDFLEHMEIEKGLSLTIREYHHYLKRFMIGLAKIIPIPNPKILTLISSENIESILHICVIETTNY